VAILNRLVDERFWSHRQRSTSVAGIVSGVASICLFYYRFVHDHVFSWDLLAIGVLFVAVKMGFMAYYALTD
jgi:hypothetical protein